MGEPSKLFGKVFAAVLIACHLLAVSMAFSAPLHHLIHHDADDSDHHCAATAILDGAIDVPDHAPLASPSPDYAEMVSFATLSQIFTPSPYFTGAGERAPPSRRIVS